MSKTDLLIGFAAALQTALPDFVVQIGTWSRVPQVNTVHIAQKHLDFGEYHAQQFAIYIAVWVTAQPSDSHAQGYAALEAKQALIESIAYTFFPAQSGITQVRLVRWEYDDGRYVPMFAAGLDAIITLQVPCPNHLI